MSWRRRGGDQQRVVIRIVVVGEHIDHDRSPLAGGGRVVIGQGRMIDVQHRWNLRDILTGQSSVVDALDFDIAQAAVPDGEVIDDTVGQSPQGIYAGIERQVSANGEPGDAGSAIEQAEIIGRADELAVPINAQGHAVGAHGEVVPDIEGAIDHAGAEDFVWPDFDFPAEDVDAAEDRIDDVRHIKKELSAGAGGLTGDPVVEEGSPLRVEGEDPTGDRSDEHTSELQSRPHLVCRLLLAKKKKQPANSHKLTHSTPTRHSTNN